MTVSVPFLMARLWWRGRHLPDYRERWAERLGFSIPLVPPGQRLIWIHAVSVGEVVVAAKIIRRLQSDYPDRVVFVTTTTPTGSERLIKEFGTSVLHTYLPWDIPWALSRLFEHLKPEALLLIETELWPNLLQQADKRRIPVMLVNARLSARSARRYARISKPLLPMFDALTRIYAQTSADARRFAALGFDLGKLNVTGNLKFDQALSEKLVSQAAHVREQWRADGKKNTRGSEYP
jgi:3-deoxy-D-manno-octulosonic-acid transferase